MTIKFSGDPFANNFPEGLFVCLNGQDETSREYIQCRVISLALSKSAGGITNEKLCHAFEQRREQIKKVTQQHYASGAGQKQKAYTVIWLSAADL